MLNRGFVGDAVSLTSLLSLLPRFTTFIKVFMTSPQMFERVDSARALLQEAHPPRAQTFNLLRSLEKIFSSKLRARSEIERSNMLASPEDSLNGLYSRGSQLFEAKSVGQALARADQRPTIPS